MSTTLVKERPILFSAPMVRAILEGRKTVTRRPVSHRTLGKPIDIDVDREFIWAEFMETPPRIVHPIQCPFGQPGDRLWVRETWGCDNREYLDLYKKEPWRGEPDPGNAKVYYRASEEAPDTFRRGYWKPSIHMPRWASRITLEIVSVRVERVWEATDADLLSEGIEYEYVGHDQREVRRRSFANSWDAIYPGSWDRNDWVWVIDFKRISSRPEEER